MNSKKIYLVRHGESTWNLEKRLQGHLDGSLSLNGIRQAEKVGATLENKISRVYSSDLERARATAEIIVKKCSVKLDNDERLRERNLGIFQGLTLLEVEAKYPEMYNKFISGDPDFIIPKGESISQTSKRINSFLNELINEKDEDNICIVTHDGIINIALREILGFSSNLPEKFILSNGSISQVFYDYEQASWFALSIGEILHLT